MLTDQLTHIETVLITASGKILDCRSFGDRARAAEYKAAARRWAAARIVAVTIQTRIMSIGETIAPGVRGPALALAS